MSLLMGFSLSLLALEELKEKIEVSEEVKVKIIEKASSESTPKSSNTISPVVEIELVEKIDATTLGLKPESSLASPTSSVSQPVAVAELVPENPDKNLVIYFILLMAIVIGIMVLASLIPASRSKNKQ